MRRKNTTERGSKRSCKKKKNWGGGWKNVRTEREGLTAHDRGEERARGGGYSSGNGYPKKASELVRKRKIMWKIVVCGKGAGNRLKDGLKQQTQGKTERQTEAPQEM